MKDKKTNIPKRKNKRKMSNAMRLFLCALLIGATAFLTWSGLQDLKTTAEIKLSIEENRKKVKELNKIKSELEETKQKLTNPDYVEYIARGKYLVTKEGEQVFKFPSIEDKEE